MAPTMSSLVKYGLGAVVALSSLADLTTAAPHARSAKLVRREELLDAYDFIVVGAGTAGLTVADRLSESGDHTVLVVEYGYLDDTPSITQVLGPRTGFSFGGGGGYGGATRMYNVSSTPQPGLDGRSKPVSAGSVVGGSSAVNGMVFDRGSAEDYDSWVWAAGGEDDVLGYGAEWGWDNILPYFKKSVTFTPPPAEIAEEFGYTWDIEAAYGGDTPIHSSLRPFQWPTQQVIWDCFKEVDGIDFPVEGAGGDAVGVFWFPNSMDPTTQTRSYSKIGHYQTSGGPAYRSNFHLLVAHRVVRLGVSGELGPEDDSLAAHGVYIMPRDGTKPDEPWKIRAKREIVVSAGAIHTPQVLQRSGVGPRDVLLNAGVEVKMEIPGVGWNFQDHQVWSMNWRFNKSAGVDSSSLQTDADFAAMAMEMWETNKTGPYTSSVNSGAFLALSTMTEKYGDIVADILSQDPAEYFPDNVDPSIVEGFKVQLQAQARQYAGTKSAVLELPFSGRTGFSVVLLRILSRGRIYLSEDDDWNSGGEMEPLVDYRAFTNPIDAKICAILTKWVRWFVNTPAMVEAFDPTETSPGLETLPDFETDEEFEEAAIEWLRGRVTPSVGHPVGTAALGPLELGGVLMPDLRVHGVMRLSVADNSIMPLLPGTHTSSTAYMIGEKAADLVKRRALEDCRMHPMDWTEEMNCVDDGGWGTHALEAAEW